MVARRKSILGVFTVSWRRGLLGGLATLSALFSIAVLLQTSPEVPGRPEPAGQARFLSGQGETASTTLSDLIWAGEFTGAQILASWKPSAVHPMEGLMVDWLADGRWQEVRSTIVGAVEKGDRARDLYSDEFLAAATLWVAESYYQDKESGQQQLIRAWWMLGSLTESHLWPRAALLRTAILFELAHLDGEVNQNYLDQARSQLQEALNHTDSHPALDFLVDRLGP